MLEIARLIRCRQTQYAVIDQTLNVNHVAQIESHLSSGGICSVMNDGPPLN